LVAQKGNMVWKLLAIEAATFGSADANVLAAMFGDVLFLKVIMPLAL